jgi:hypothetical protein
MKVNVEKFVEELTRETEVLGANPFQYHSLQIVHDLNWDVTQVLVVGGWRLTA